MMREEAGALASLAKRELSEALLVALRKCRRRCSRTRSIMRTAAYVSRRGRTPCKRALTREPTGTGCRPASAYSRKQADITKG
jgi:hypothetical protein